MNVGLTGNIAAGKSAVAELFRRWGATIIDADEIVRELQSPGSPILQTIAARFGRRYLLPDGSLDRPALRRVVMADAEARAQLNRIVHPAVEARRRELLAQAAGRGDRVIISDIPLLFETADPAQFDTIVLVDAPEDVRLGRLMQSRGLAELDARQMIAAQMPAAEKRARSEFVIDNAGDRMELERAAMDVWQALLARA